MTRSDRHVSGGARLCRPRPAAAFLKKIRVGVFARTTPDQAAAAGLQHSRAPSDVITSRIDQKFSKNVPAAESFKRKGRFCERINEINHWRDFPVGSPFERGLDVGAISSVTADKPLLLHKDRPQIQRHLTLRSRTAGDDGSVPRKAIETFHQRIAADVFDDEINAASVRDLADGGGPVRIGRIHDVFRAELERELSLGFS